MILPSDMDKSHLICFVYMQGVPQSEREGKILLEHQWFSWACILSPPFKMLYFLNLSFSTC